MNASNGANTATAAARRNNNAASTASTASTGGLFGLGSRQPQFSPQQAGQSRAARWLDSVRGGVSNFFAGTAEALRRRNMLVLFLVLAFLAILGIIVYVVYKLRQRNLQAITLVSQPLKLFGMTGPKTFGEDSIAPTLNGQEHTFSFWLYLVDYDQPSVAHRPLMMRSGGEDALSTASTVMFMDGQTNRLYISARTNRSGSVDDLADLTPQNLVTNGKNYLTATVEYVPLQRWVNVVCVQQDNLMTVYLDGELYTVRNVHDLVTPERGGAEHRPMFSGSSGDVIVGAASSDATPVRGFMSGLKFYNYALMESDVRAVYGAGPTMRSLADTIGIAGYGLQSPVYKREDGGA